MGRQSLAEDIFFQLLLQAGVQRHLIERQFRFHPKRNWQADFAIPAYRILIEVEGGIYMPGRKGHASIKGIERDIEKYNEAAFLGWAVYRTTTKTAHMKELARRLAELWA